MTAKLRDRALAPARSTARKGAGSYHRKSHTRRTKHGAVQVRRSKAIPKLGRAYRAVRDAPTASYATWQAFTAEGSRREQAKFAAKLGASAGVATAVGVGQVASVGVSILAAVAVCAGSFAWYLTRKAEPKGIRRARQKWFRAARKAKFHIRRQIASAQGTYRGTRRVTTIAGPGRKGGELLSLEVLTKPKTPRRNR